MTAQPSPRRDGEIAVELPTEISIRTVEDARRRLVEAIATGASVTAHLAPDAEIDLNGVQLLCAARRSAEQAGGGFALAAPAANHLLETLRRGGFLQTAEQQAFWLKHQGEH